MLGLWLADARQPSATGALPLRVPETASLSWPFRPKSNDSSLLFSAIGCSNIESVLLEATYVLLKIIILCKILQKIPRGLWENGRHTHTNSIYDIWKTQEPNKNDWQYYTCSMIKKQVNTKDIAFLPWKRPWSLLVEGHLIRVAACELLQSGSRKLIWNSKKSCCTRWG